MRAPDFVVGSEAGPYLHRWWVIPRNRWFNIYLHHFLRSDDDRALHDHRAANLSIILKGSYLEHLQDGQVKLRKPWRPWAPWRLVFRRAATPHCVELQRICAAGPFGPMDSKEVPVWTLFLTGPHVREWGFHCPQGWKHWADFTKAGTPGEVGPGCGE